MSKKAKLKNTPHVNPELEGFNLKIDQFGEIKSSMPIEKINAFLNENVEDKKLKNRKEFKKKSKGK